MSGTALALAVTLLWTACNGIQILLLLLLMAREREAVLRALSHLPDNKGERAEGKAPLHDRLKELKEKWREPAKRKGGEKE